MKRMILSACLLAAAVASAAHAGGLNDRTKKLLQTQSLNRAQQPATTRNPNTPSDDARRSMQPTQTPGAGAYALPQAGGATGGATVGTPSQKQ